MKIKIKYFTDIIPLKQISIGNWIDLRLAENVSLKAGDFKILPLGVAIKLHDGYEAHIVPRSSTYKTYGLIQSNGIGIIDNSYSGNNDQWMFPVIATRDVELVKNDRISQFRIMEIQPNIEFEIVEDLDPTDRGGFGSTGIQ